jgi:ADP-ribosyl-[dinitrogen reductase] hydrolase
MVNRARDGVVDKFKGCIFGAAIGDALGMPTEYISRAQLDSLYGGRVVEFEDPSPDHPCGHLKAGQWTDDTQQIIVLSESLIALQGFNIVDFGRKMGIWADKCANEPGYNRFGGGTSMKAGLALHNGGDPEKTGERSETCGAAMRIAPIGLFYHDNQYILKEAAWDASRVTHSAISTIESGVFVASMIGYLVNGEEPVQAARKANESLTSRLKDINNSVIENRDVDPQVLMKTIGASESVYETVPMALSCFIHSPEEFQTTVVNAANMVPGDTDSIACIAGALSGAYNGVNGIPSGYRSKLEDREYLEGLSTKLYRISELGDKRNLSIMIDVARLAKNDPLGIVSDESDSNTRYRTYLNILAEDLDSHMSECGRTLTAEERSKSKTTSFYDGQVDLMKIQIHYPNSDTGSGIEVKGPGDEVQRLIGYFATKCKVAYPDKFINYVGVKSRR